MFLTLPLAATAHEAPGSRRSQLAAVLRDGDGLLVDKPRSASPQPWSDFETELRQREDAGQRVHDLEVVILKNLPMFTAVWRPGEGHVHIEPVMTARQLEDARQHLSAAGYRLTDLESYESAGARLYAGVWMEGDGEEEVRLGLDREGFERERLALLKRGLVLTDFESWRFGGERRYAGLWRPGNATVEVLLLEVPWPTFEPAMEALGAGNLRLEDLEIYEVKERTVYSGVWHVGREAYWSWIGFREECLDRKVVWLASEKASKSAEPEPQCRPGEGAGGLIAPTPTTTAAGRSDGSTLISSGGATEIAASEDHRLLPELEPPDPTHADLPPLAIEDFELTGLLPMPEEEGAQLHSHATGDDGKAIINFHLGVAHDGGSSGPDI